MKTGFGIRDSGFAEKKAIGPETRREKTLKSFKELIVWQKSKQFA